jgi:predicted GNAT superfamily acetyltransferase
VSVNEVIEISAIPTDLSDAERNDPDAMFAITIEKSLEIEKLKVEIAKYKEKEAATKKRQGMNSRGRPKR